MNLKNLLIEMTKHVVLSREMASGRVETPGSAAVPLNMMHEPGSVRCNSYWVPTGVMMLHLTAKCTAHLFLNNMF